jgi:hypothetical protein
MASSKPAADEVQDQVEAPTESNNQTEKDAAAALESDEISFDDVEDDGKPFGADDAESEEDEDNESGISDDFDDSDEEGEAEESNEEEQSDEEGEEPAKPDPEKPQAELTAEEIKERNREMAARRLAAKDQREAVIESKKKEYIDGADNEDEAFKRTTEVELYNSRVERNENSLVSASERAFADFPILNDKDPAIQRRVNKAIDAFQAQHVTIDAFGNATRVKGDLYEYLKDEADDIQALTGRGAREQVKSKAKEKSKTFTRPVRKPQSKKGDPMVEAFEEEANRY